MKHLYESILDDEEDILDNTDIDIINDTKSQIFSKLAKTTGCHFQLDSFKLRIEKGDLVISVDPMGWGLSIMTGDFFENSNRFEVSYEPDGIADRFSYSSVVIKESRNPLIQDIIDTKDINKKLKKLEKINKLKYKNRLARNTDFIGSELKVGDFVLFGGKLSMIYPGIVCDLDPYDDPKIAEDIQSYNKYINKDPETYMIRSSIIRRNHLVLVKELDLINKYIK